MRQRGVARNWKKVVKENNQLVSLGFEDQDKSIFDKNGGGDYPGQNIEPDAEENFRLRDYWLAARKRLWLILAITFLVTALATIYMASKPDVYEAQARVQVDLESPNPALGAASKSGSVVVSNTYNDPTYF